MFNTCAMDNIVDKISSIVGSQAVIAKKLSIHPMAVTQWRSRGVPAKWVLELEKLSGVPCWEIRPDIYPPERFRDAPPRK